MASQQGAGGSPGVDGTLVMEAARRSEPKCLALLECPSSVTSVSGEHQRADVNRCVTFEGIALGPGTYVDAASRRIRVRAEHLPLVAERVQGVFLRDLHREDLGASVGVVAAARVEGGEVRFTGDVRLAPYVDIVREFWPSIRFSLGFRYDPAGLVQVEDGTFDLPMDFVIDHLALVPQGQYPNARLVRLLNQARGLASHVPRSVSMTEENKDAVVAASEASRREVDHLRQQRDDALRAAENANANTVAASEASRRELEQARGELGKARADLDAASKLAEAARFELGQAKNRLAAEVMKLELSAGRDFDLDQRKKELTSLELGSLDKLRGELRLAAAHDGDGGEPTTVADQRPAAPKDEALDLEALSLDDTLRLAFRRGAL